MKNLVKMLLVASLVTFNSFIGNAKTLNISNVKKELIRVGVKYPEIVLRQIILETGWLKCTACSLSKNNLFGLTKSIKVDGKSKRVYQTFDTWENSVLAYKKWQDRWYESGDYYDFLECIYKNKKGECKRYATEPEYVPRLKRINLEYEIY